MRSQLGRPLEGVPFRVGEYSENGMQCAVGFSLQEFNGRPHKRESVFDRRLVGNKLRHTLLNPDSMG